MISRKSLVMIEGKGCRSNERKVVEERNLERAL